MGGGDDSGKEKDCDDGKGTALAEFLNADKTEFDEEDDGDREFEGEAESDDELGREGVVIPNRPDRVPVHFFGILKKEIESHREDDGEGEEATADEEERACDDGGDEQFFFGFFESRDDVATQEIEDEGEGGDEARVEGNLEGDHEGVRNTDGLEASRVGGVDDGERALDEVGKLEAEEEAEGHADAQRKHDTEDRSAQVFEVTDEAFLFFVSFAELE